MPNKIDHPQLGKITLTQSRRSRRILLTVRNSGEVRLSFPVSVSRREALRFAESRKEWVLENISKYRENIVVIEPPYSTRQHTLRLTATEGVKIATKISGGVINVQHPATLQVYDSGVQAAIKKGVEEAWRIEAKEMLPSRVEELASEFGFKYGKITIRNTVSKWGSCSSQNNLSLSLHLMRLPDHLIDYVLTHELCHTIHKNHGPKFHSLLEQLTLGHHTILNTELRKYNTRW